MCNPHQIRSRTPTPIACSDPHDDRPFVKDLLEQHAASIKSVRQRILSDDTFGKPLWDPKRYDDIWILRYVLSHKGNAKHAAKAALKTMKMRDEKKLNDVKFSDIRRRIKNFGFKNDESIESLPNFDVYNSYCGENSYIITSQPDPDRGVLVFADIARIDFQAMLNDMSEEELKEHVLYLNEALFQILDEVTRRTGRLAKLTRFIDMGNFSFLNMDYKSAKLDAVIQKELEDYHPQLLTKVYFFNNAAWISAAWTALRPFFPKRVTEKVDFLPWSASRKLHQPILKQVSEANLPEKFGGKNKEWPLPSVAEKIPAV